MKGLSGPSWFPDYIESCAKGILLLKEIKEGGIYFVKYPASWEEEIKNLLKSFFTMGSGEYFKSDEKEMKLSEPLDNSLVDFIDEFEFEAGKRNYSFRLKDRNLVFLENGEKKPVDHESHQTLLNSLRVTNSLIKESVDYICFQINAGELDDSTSNALTKIFKYLHERTKDEDEYLIVFYSDEDRRFTEDHLLTENCLTWWASINEENYYRIENSYEECIDYMEKTLESNNFETIDFFLGAGASVSSGMPTGRRMLEKALEDYVGKEGSIEQLIPEAKEKDSRGILPGDEDKITVENIMSVIEVDNLYDTNVLEDFCDKNSEAVSNPSKGYDKLNSLSTDFSILCVTSNFDEILDGNLNYEEKITKKQDFERISPESIVERDEGNYIVKLHGTIGEPHTIGIQEEDIEEFPYYKKNFMNKFLRKEADPDGPHRVFIIGYDFADEDIRGVLLSEIERQTTWPIIVSPEKTKNIEDFMGEFDEETDDSGAISPTFIPFTFDFFMKKLEEIIESAE